MALSLPTGGKEARCVGARMLEVWEVSVWLPGFLHASI